MPDGFSLPKSSIRTVEGVIRAGLAPEAARAGLDAVARRYAIAIPPALRALIGAADDPIGLQFIPDAAELVTAPHESADPIGDEALSPVRGVVHRYKDRALLKPLLACPVYCRFCFRREQVGPDGGVLSGAELDTAYGYIAAHPEIREVILTGGDPLILSPRRLSGILAALSAIPHVEVLRIHTRAPVADPALVTDALADALDIPVPLFVALHANHARELTPEVGAAVEKLQRRRIPVLGQTVLLAGVNDSEAALADLFRAMLRLRIKPYYLHQLDAAPGTARFHVPVERGREIMRNLRGTVSGTALPVYIYDQPGGLGKVPLMG
jgi:lysine 2,3-aminomutase